MLCLNSLKISDMTRYIKEHADMIGDIEVQFEDGTYLTTTIRRVVFHMFFWKICKKWRLPITQRYMDVRTYVDMSTVNAINGRIYEDIPGSKTDLQRFKKDIWVQLNDIMNFIIINCQEYHKDADIVSMCELAKTKELREVIDTKINGKRDSAKESELSLKKNFEKIGDIISNLDVPCNTLRTFTNLKFINNVQLSHIFYQIGFRTDISDKIIPYSISSGYLEGLKTLEDMVFESLSAKKSIFYNKMSIPDSQYSNRTQHLLSSVLPNLHPGDCGSTVYLPMYLNAESLQNFAYKYALIEGQLTVLTDAVLQRYTGTTVLVRSPTTCKFNDGCCEVCGGTLMTTIPNSKHIGIISAIKVTNAVVQKILSSKHFQTTNIKEYVIPFELKDVFTLKHQDIVLRPKIRTRINSLSIGIPVSSALSVINLKGVKRASVEKVSESQFGVVTKTIFKTNRGVMTDLVDMETDGKYPVMSKDFINHIRAVSKDVTTDDDILWIPLSGFDPTKPIYRALIENDSMIAFVSKYSKFITKELKNFTNLQEAFESLYSIITSKVTDINVCYIEMILKAFMVNGDFNVSIPIVSDSEDVQFKNINELVTRRSLGATLAYQELSSTVVNPLTYLQPRPESAFDNFLGMQRIKYRPKTLS